MGSDLNSILEQLRKPLTAESLALKLSYPTAVLGGLLRQLEARGLITEAKSGLGACSSGCGVCSMQNFCPGSENQERLEASKVWRLTFEGEKLIKSAGPPSARG